MTREDSIQAWASDMAALLDAVGDVLGAPSGGYRDGDDWDVLVAAFRKVYPEAEMLRQYGDPKPAVAEKKSPETYGLGIVGLLHSLTPDEREKAMEVVNSTFCFGCWGPKYPYPGFKDCVYRQPCQCQNDE